MANQRAQREVLKSVASTLKRASIPFALAGGYAVWARGGPESQHDVDFLLRPADVETCRSSLMQAGFNEHPWSEDWLSKVESQDVVVDLIHRLPIGEVDDQLLERTDELSVDSVRMPVMSATDLLLCRLLVMTEHACDFGQPLAFARALREQVDWERVRAESAGNPFARAFLTLLEDLDVLRSANARIA